MDASHELAEARNEAFRRIGLNVFLFQRIEGMLKYLDAVSQFEVTRDDLARFKEGEAPRLKLSKSSMGLVKESALNKIYTDGGSDTDTEKPWSEDIIGKISFQVEATKDQIEEHHQTLKALIVERNCLIHTTLDRMNPNSQEDWLNLSEELDQQRLRILPELERLQSFVRVSKNHKSYMDSEHFRSVLLGDNSDE